MTHRRCISCNQLIPVGSRQHDCPEEGLLDVFEDGSFFVSAAIGAMTDSALLGGAIGGDLLGGIVGDLLDGDLFD